MKNEKIYILGEKIGLNKNDIDDTLKDRISINKTIPISYRTDCYKNGPIYGAVSIKDL